VIDDFALLERWQADDRQAGEQLCTRYFADIYRFFEYKIEDRADDLVQQTFMACLKGRTQFRSESSFRTYLFAIARNELYMELRKTRRDHVDLEVSSLEELVSSPSKQLGKHQEQARLRAVLRELPVDQQTLIELHYWHELSAIELAEVFSTTPGSIRVRLLRARRALRARLTEAPDRAAPADRLWQSLREPELDLHDRE
jgi:RNA polymerase sigma-70 factor (ECF subfamily)